MHQRGTKVLVVDDDPEWIGLMKELLEGEGYLAIAAENGMAGLEQLRRFEPKIVITDLQMPVLDGRQFLSRVHSYDERVPVIVVTTEGETATSGLPGAFRVVGKLSAIDGLLSAVADAAAQGAARPPVHELSRSRAGCAALADARSHRSLGRFVRWGRARVSSAFGRISSSPLRRPILLTAVVLSTAVALLQLTPRITA